MKTLHSCSSSFFWRCFCFCLIASEYEEHVQFRRIHTMFPSPCARPWSLVWKPHNYRLLSFPECYKTPSYFFGTCWEDLLLLFVGLLAALNLPSASYFLSFPLCEIACAMVPILPRTNPYSFEKRKYGGISGSGHATWTLSIRTRILPESNFFRGMEYPMSGHVIETHGVRTCKRPYFSRHTENHGVPLMNVTLFAFHFQ